MAFTKILEKQKECYFPWLVKLEVIVDFALVP